LPPPPLGIGDVMLGLFVVGAAPERVPNQFH
jgi:hypothetical protein